MSAGSSGRIDPLGRVNGMGGSWAGRMRWANKRGEDRVTKEDMGSSGVSEDGRRGDRTQQGSIVTVVVVGIVRFHATNVAKGLV